MGLLSRIGARAPSVLGGLGVAGLLFFGALAGNPAGQEGIPSQQNPHRSSPFGPETPLDPTFADRQLRVLNAERQKSMVSDAEKLLKLAQELNAEIQTANPDTELRKISDIEKLARNVKQKMSTSLVGGPSFHDPTAPLFR
jgi:hypothetical protein